MIWGRSKSESVKTDAAGSPSLTDDETSLGTMAAYQQGARGILYRIDKAGSRELKLDRNRVGKESDNNDKQTGPDLENMEDAPKRTKDKIYTTKSKILNALQDQEGNVLGKVSNGIQNNERPGLDERMGDILDDIKMETIQASDKRINIIKGMKEKNQGSGVHDVRNKEINQSGTDETTPPVKDEIQTKLLKVINKIAADEPTAIDAENDTIKGVKDKLDTERERRQLPNKGDINEHCKSMKFVVYDCLADHCGGWGDKQTGIIAAYLLAKVMRRRFVIQAGACDISKFFIPNEYNWKLCQDFISSVPAARTLTFDFYNNPNEYKTLIDNLDPQKFPLTQVMFIRTNQLWNDLILSNIQRAEVDKASSGKTVSKVSERVLGMLFKPVDDVQIGINDFRKQLVDRKKLVCADIYGNKPYTELRDMKSDTGIHASAIDVISAFLNIFNNPSKYSMYVASSSKAVIDHYKGMILNDVKIESLINDNDNPPEKAETECKELFTEFLEQIILKECDILLLTNSNLGKIAAYTSRKVQSLFYFIDKEQTIVKITKDEIQNYNFQKILGQD